MSQDIYRLPGRSVISLNGPDARPLLQRVITADVENLDAGECRPGALLTPQGKIICDFMIFPHDDGLYLDIVDIAAPALSKKLTLYKLKADVVISLREDLASLWSGATFDGAAPDPRLGLAIYRAIGGGARETRPIDDLEIAAGIPVFGRDYGEAEVFPTDVNLDAYDGVGWTKGCFIGQEVVSRMKRRGTIRKRSLASHFAEDAPPAGTALTTQDATIGEISSSSGHNAVSRVRLDRLEKAQDAVMADGKAATLDLPDALKPGPAPERV